MPGIVETHAHVPGQADPALREIMALYVLTGATTIRAMNGTPFQLELRRQIAGGEILGPTLFAVAPPFSGQSVSDPDDARRKVREFKALGFDVLKIFPGMSAATYDAITATAREVGIPYSGHVPPSVGLRHAIAQGQSVEHLDGYVEASRGDGAAIDGLVRATREAGIWNTPTLDVWKTILGTRPLAELQRRPELRYMPRDVVEGWTAQTVQLAQRSLAQEGHGTARHAQVATRDRGAARSHPASAPARRRASAARRRLSPGLQRAGLFARARDARDGRGGPPDLRGARGRDP